MNVRPHILVMGYEWDHVAEPVAVPIEPVGPADQTAYALFLAALNSREREEWEHQRTITIVGSGGVRYTIDGGNPRLDTFNVYSHKDHFGRCCYPRAVPKHDILLAQKLLLESDESQFLFRAYRGPWGSPQPTRDMVRVLLWVRYNRL